MSVEKPGTAVLYKRSRWRKALDEAKIEMQLSRPFAQDLLDHSLFTAVQENNCRAMREMVALGANPNMALQPKEGQTACTLLHVAALSHSHRTVSTLLQLGANPLALDSHGLTARDYASRNANTGRVRTLLKLWEQKRVLPVNDDRLSVLTDQKKETGTVG